jgi:hypothetical protein
MATQSSIGTCKICGRAFNRLGMTRHLKTCRPAGARGGGYAFHTLIDQRHGKKYWLHVAVPFSSRLSTLDSFLRRTWLECCGHLSAFTIQGVLYRESPQDEIGGRSTAVRADRVLYPGLAFTYEYDFGSTTELTLKVVGIRECGPEVKLELLARNEPPQILCSECDKGELATRVCIECVDAGGGWLCDDCAETHSCGEDMLLPVVNSPRVGVCGYAG